jgi:translation initiation factor 2B subunit (eIF-2B alpha/beta/delta family)
VENQALRRRAEEIAQDRDRGAGELLALLLPLLADALADGPELTLQVVRRICYGQPAMAPLWNACAAAVADGSQPGRFARVRAEMERAPAALVRAAQRALDDLLPDDRPPHLITLSYSSSVARLLAAVAAKRTLHVTCAEGRPRFEGRRMAADLAAAGAAVTLTIDAAITASLDRASALVVGADAFDEICWTTMVGTRGTAAAAYFVGVPVYVVCTRDKARSSSAAVPVPNGEPHEIWADPPERISVSNPYFEPTPVELATLFLTEAGPIPPSQLGQIVLRYSADISLLRNSLQVS